MGRRRRKQDGIDAWLDLAARMPWWASLLLAILIYLILRQLASQGAGDIHDSSEIGAYAGRHLLIAFSTIGQYVIPLILAGGALQSFLLCKSTPKEKHYKEPKLSFGKSNRSRKEKSPEKETDFYAIYKSVSQQDNTEIDTQIWSLELLKAIDWKRFEEVCAEYFRLCGFDAETQTHGPDGGIDIKLYRKGDRGQIENIVQCKQYTNRKIGPKMIRELLGVMTDQGLMRGIFVTASDFNEEAKSLAKKNDIFLINGITLVDKIKSCPEGEQERLLAIATEGDYLTPTCARCGIKMVRRPGRYDRPFWGCRNYPRCHSTLQMASESQAKSETHVRAG